MNSNASRATASGTFFNSAIAISAVPLFFIAIIIDRYAYLPGWLRAVGALALLAVASVKAWRHSWSSMRGFDAASTAQTIEQSQGGMDSLLVTGEGELVVKEGSAAAIEIRLSGVVPKTAIIALQVGDSVSFVVEVADKYPGDSGPHRARTESRGGHQTDGASPDPRARALPPGTRRA